MTHLPYLYHTNIITRHRRLPKTRSGKEHHPSRHSSAPAPRGADSAARPAPGRPRPRASPRRGARSVALREKQTNNKMLSTILARCASIKIPGDTPQGSALSPTHPSGGAGLCRSERNGSCAAAAYCSTRRRWGRRRAGPHRRRKWKCC